MNIVNYINGTLVITISVLSFKQWYRFFLYIATSVYSTLFNFMFFIFNISAIFKSLLCNCMYVCLHIATLSHGIGTIMYVCVHFLLYWKLLSRSQIPHWKKLKQLSNKKHGQMTGRYGCQTKKRKITIQYCYFTDFSLTFFFFFTV